MDATLLAPQGLAGPGREAFGVQGCRDLGVGRPRPAPRLPPELPHPLDGLGLARCRRLACEPIGPTARGGIRTPSGVFRKSCSARQLQRITLAAQRLPAWRYRPDMPRHAPSMTENVSWGTVFGGQGHHRRRGLSPAGAAALGLDPDLKQPREPGPAEPRLLWPKNAV